MMTRKYSLCKCGARLYKEENIVVPECNMTFKTCWKCGLILVTEYSVPTKYGTWTFSFKTAKAVEDKIKKVDNFKKIR